MSDTLQEMEQEQKDRDNKEDPNIVRKAMEAALLFGGAK